MQIRNIAIIAHVDHGKTLLTDALMCQTGMSDENSSMDNNVLEKERGITIYSKNTSVFYKDTKINIVDTPGHADFGSEVERVLRSIDSVLLVIDAQEGPMPQTKFVLKKSLELGLKPIVIINKIDKQAARPEIIKEQVFELFLELDATDEQLNFETVYTIGRDGIAKLKIEDESSDLTPLLDTIIRIVPPAKSDISASLRFQVFNLGYDNFFGRLAVGRIHEGIIKTNSDIIVKKITDETRNAKITKLFTFHGVERKEVSEAVGGDIVMIAGIPDVYIGETICINANQEPLPEIKIDEPTISLNFLVNNSPFAGREGKFVTNRQIKERLKKELETNVGLRIDFSTNDFYKVFGRGELHIAILLESMRREGYELQVSQPQVIIKEKENIKLEPFEEVTISVPVKFTGTVIKEMSKRKGKMIEMLTESEHTKIIFEIPTRGLLGYRSKFIINTKGKGILYSRIIGFKKHAGTIKKNDLGSMISMTNGKAFGYDLWNLQERGEIYIDANTNVYQGMIIGNVSKGSDMDVNPTKGKKLTNTRASGSDEAIRLIPPLKLSLERGMEIMNEDEYLEVTPKSIRLRKKHLNSSDRVKTKRSQNKSKS